MLYVLFLVSLLFLLFNLAITRRDYLHPTNLILLILTIYNLIIIMFSSRYQVDIIFETVSLFTIFYLIITALTIVSKLFYRNGNEKYVEELQEIKLDPKLTYIIFGVNLYWLYEYRNFVTHRVNDVYGGYENLSDMIDKFQNYGKFLAPYVSLTSNYESLILRFTPLILAICYIILYITVHNFYVTRKFNVFNVLIIGTLIGQYLLSGSRSPIFRVITFVIFVYIYLKLKSKKENFNFNFSFIIKIVPAIILIGAMFLSLLSVIGRDVDFTESGVDGHIFAYTAAPIVNLNNYLRDTYVYDPSNLFGEQTLSGIYNYLYGVTGDSNYRVLSITEFLPFTESDNGIWLGNVYTTFYMFMHDNGYLGVIIFSIIMFVYYIFAYSGIMAERNNVGLSLKVLVYAYLFNDLIMLTFSNRFYETVATTNFVKFMISLIIVSYVLKRIKVK